MREALLEPQVATRRFGAIALPDGSTTWRLWAPRANAVELVLIDGTRRRTVPMAAESPGVFTHTEEDVLEGQRYAYRLDGGEERQDPCSLFQPTGVPGPSAVVRTDDFRWTDNGWAGVERRDLVIYELHVGTFTREGTFEAIIRRLASLAELGVRAIELMPVGQFPGTRNWGYDGVLPYAAQNSYGGPRGLQKLVDAAHAAGLAVILDVVYNHLGPEHNYVHQFAPYFTDKYKTPWGSAVNYDDRDSDCVREWVLDNARMWLAEFHLDGLRLDAVHAIYDRGARHILAAMKNVAEEVADAQGRRIHVIGESDLNDPRIVLPPERGGYGLDAQWADDFHHAVHALLTGERRGYYQDFGRAEDVAEAFRTPYLFAGRYSPHRGRKHGAPVPPGVSGDQFVVCIQNHDQVGNRARGDRLSTLLASPPRRRLAASLLLLSPYIPLIFMGEEYGEQRPFPFFCSFCGPELIEAVRQGRKREFADFVSDVDEIPDPAAPETFESARLSWSWPAGTEHAGIRRLYEDLLRARRTWAALRNFDPPAVRIIGNPSESPVLEVTRTAEVGARDALRIYFNLGEDSAPLPPEPRADRTPAFSSEWRRYGGGRDEADFIRELRAAEAVVFGPVGLSAIGSDNG